MMLCEGRDGNASLREQIEHVITVSLEAAREDTSSLRIIFLPSELQTGCPPDVSKILSAGRNLFIVTTQNCD
jgi:hypothetical protein